MKKNMNTQLLKKLYNIYSPSGKEQEMIRFLCSYINGLHGNISLQKDSFGNLYVTKGNSESYPCLVSHLDQISHCRHSKDFRVIEAEGILFGYSPSKRRYENLELMTKTAYSSAWNACRNTMSSKSCSSAKKKPDAKAVLKHTCRFLMT